MTRYAMVLRGVLAAATALAGTAAAHAQAFAAPRVPAAPNKVVVAGDVPDEATRQDVLQRLHALYGADNVVDQLGVRPLVAPPAWSRQVVRLLHADLKHVSRGQLDIRGNAVEVRGEVANEALRQQVLSQLANQLANTTYTVRSALRVAGAGQAQVDAALAYRVVEFEPGSATLTGRGQAVLDELLPVLRRLPDRTFEIVGHTDSIGDRLANLSLSAARAQTVATYLVGRGMASAALDTLGAGPDRPVAANDTAEGRARNRRIEIRVAQ